ncbi:hypothetical protein R3P38DRAFT_2803884 [Favolaschia claudopus]|uniref:Uncharacterized protein n=1 Tax=Favolaschia claudopus TaxID=2862362 RepID=A0AAV9ZS20_9AGAR
MNYIRQVVLHQEPKAAKPASTNINLSLSELPSAQLANASDVDVEEFEMSKTKTSSALPAELLINQSQTRSSLGQEMIDAPFVRTRKQDKTDAIDFTRTVEAVVSEIADAGKDGGQQDSADIWNERRLAFVGSRSRPDAGEVRLNLWWQWTRDRCARENAGLWKNITSSASECSALALASSPLRKTTKAYLVHMRSEEQNVRLVWERRDIKSLLIADMAKIEGGPIGMAVSNEWCIVRKACACSSAGSIDLKIRNPLTGHSPSPSIALLTPSYVAAKQISFEFERRINQLKREIRHYSDSDQMEGRAYLANGADPVHDHSSKTSLRLTSTMTSLVDVGALGTSKAQTSATLSAEDEKSRYLLLNQCRRQLCASLGQEIIGLPFFQTCKSLHPLLPSMFASASNDSLGGEETGETDCPRAAGISYQVARSASTIKTKSPSPPPANAEGIEGGGLWTATSEMMTLQDCPRSTRLWTPAPKGYLPGSKSLIQRNPPHQQRYLRRLNYYGWDVWGPPLVCAVDQKDKGMQRGWDAPLIRVNQLSSTPVTVSDVMKFPVVTRASSRESRSLDKREWILEVDDRNADARTKDIDRDHIADVGATRTSQ